MEEVEGNTRGDYQILSFAGQIDEAQQLQTLATHLGEEVESFLMEKGAYGFQFMPQSSSRLCLHIVFAPGDIDPAYDSFFALSQ